MITTFVQRDEHGNAFGVNLELDPLTEAEVKRLRAWYARRGFKENNRTRKLSDLELSVKTQVYKKKKRWKP